MSFRNGFRFGFVCMLGVLGIFGQSSAFGEDPVKKDPPKIYCPVAGISSEKSSCCCPNGYCPKVPKPAITVEFETGKVQLCCSQCVALFKKTPEKFLHLANHQFLQTGQAKQVKCPITGEAFKKDVFLTVSTVTVFFSSEDAKKKVQDAKVIPALELVFGKAGFQRGFELSTKK